MMALDEGLARPENGGVPCCSSRCDHSSRFPGLSPSLAMARRLHYPVAFASEARENGFGTPSVLPVTLIDPDGIVRAAFHRR